MEDWKERGKEEAPVNTVKKIKEILKKNNMEYKVAFETCHIDNCYSSRVVITNKNTGDYIGTNGKGLSKDFCEASALGELMERIENRMFITKLYQFRNVNDLYIDTNPIYDVFDEEHEIPCIKRIKENIAETIDKNYIFGSKLDFVNLMFKKMADVDQEGKFSTLPFYSFSEKKIVYLPTQILNMFLGSNGMAAGNTIEEAMVEGMSEIVERYSQMKFLREKVVPPLLPDDVIDKYPKIREMINKITADKKHSVYIYDCSLGIDLPVVAGIIVDKEKNKLGLKFGAHPNMAIALERIFTEAFQGSSLDDFCNRDDIDFEYKNIDYNVWNHLKVGYGSLPATFFYDKKSYEYKPWKDVSKCSNRELMFDYVDLFNKMGGEVYVRDASYLGFPAVQIYVAGISEVKLQNIVSLKEMNTIMDVNNIFNDLENISDKDVETLRLLCILKRSAILENKLPILSGRFWKEKVLGDPIELDFLYVVCNYVLGKYKTAHETMKIILSYKQFFDDDTIKYFNAITFFFNGLSAGLNDEEILSAIEKLVEKKYVDRIRETFLDRKKVLSKLYKSCDNKCENCEKDICYSKGLIDFFKYLVKCEKENPVNEEELVKRFIR